MQIYEKFLINLKNYYIVNYCNNINKLNNKVLEYINK